MLRSDGYLGHKKGHFGGADLAKNGGFCIGPLNALSGVLAQIHQADKPYLVTNSFTSVAYVYVQPAWPLTSFLFGSPLSLPVYNPPRGDLDSSRNLDSHRLLLLCDLSLRTGSLVVSAPSNCISLPQFLKPLDSPLALTPDTSSLW